MFSETVDRVIEISKRPDRLLDIIDYTNMTLRLLHSEHTFTDDLSELRLRPSGGLTTSAPASNFFTPPPPLFGGWHHPAAMEQLQTVGGPSAVHVPVKSGQNVHVWPTPRTFRQMQAVRYDGHCYAMHQQPNRNQNQYCEYWYKLGGHHVFVGWKEVVDLFYISYPPHFKYFTPTERPAVLDRGTGQFMYRAGLGPHVSSLGNATTHDMLERQVYDWMLDRWQSLVVDGVLTKLYVALGDERAAQHNAMYQRDKQHMIQTERVSTPGPT